jgi:hypothetical protein
MEFHKSKKGEWLCEHHQKEDKHPACFRETGKISDTGIEQDYGLNTGIITTRSANITTVDKALECSKVDLNIWEVERYVINSWEVTMSKKSTSTDKPETYTNYQVKVWLKRKKPVEKAIETVEKRLRTHKTVFPKRLNKNTGKYMLEVSLFDAHFGKLCWEQETGDNFDLKIAEKIYQEAVEDLIAKTKGWDIESIIFPVGNDFFHINSPDNVTPTNKNPLDVDDRLPKVFETGFMATVKAIDYCLGVAPVDVYWIPGNHDPETSYYLCRILKEHYRKSKDVDVDISPKTRKYVQYGVVCLMFAHSPKINQKAGLPLIMAAEQPEMWGKAKHREIHTGHYHKATEIQFVAGDTYGPVRVRVLPSLTGTDLWHYEQGYVKTMRAAEAYLWHKERGYEGHFSTGVR